jgi:hypothetical protein
VGPRVRHALQQAVDARGAAARGRVRRARSAGATDDGRAREVAHPARRRSRRGARPGSRGHALGAVRVRAARRGGRLPGHVPDGVRSVHRLRRGAVAVAEPRGPGPGSRPVGACSVPHRAAVVRGVPPQPHRRAARAPGDGPVDPRRRRPGDRDPGPAGPGGDLRLRRAPPRARRARPPRRRPRRRPLRHGPASSASTCSTTVSPSCTACASSPSSRWSPTT